MKALVYHGDGGGLRWENPEDPDPGPDDVIVDVAAAGICGTDAQFLRGRLVPWKLPLILGHEIAGVVRSAGSGVRGFRPGDRVACHYHDPCGRCPPCAGGSPSLCDNPNFFMGFSDNGGFATRARVPSSCLVQIPARLSFADAASLVCSATTARRAVEVAGPASGPSLVIGCGPVGLHCIRLLHLNGMRVACTSRSSAKLDYGMKAGAASALSPWDVAPDEFGLVIDTVSSSDSFRLAVEKARKLGKVVVLGFSATEVPLDVTSLVTKGLQILTSCGATRDDLLRVLELADEGLLPSFVEHPGELRDLERLIRDVEAGSYTGKMVVRMQQT
jgi:propanol-preferring alcohol dehydrogenase